MGVAALGVASGIATSIGFVDSFRATITAGRAAASARHIPAWGAARRAAMGVAALGVASGIATAIGFVDSFRAAVTAGRAAASARYIPAWGAAAMGVAAA
jgi:hypothetical protein